MHPLMLQKVVESCRARIAEGDCPTTPPFPIEQLEEAVAELAGIPRDDARRMEHLREKDVTVIKCYRQRKGYRQTTTDAPWEVWDEFDGYTTSDFPGREPSLPTMNEAIDRSIAAVCPLEEAVVALAGRPLREPFVVRNYEGDGGPTIKGNAFDGLRVGEDREEAEHFVEWVNARLFSADAERRRADALWQQCENYRIALQELVREAKHFSIMDNAVRRAERVTTTGDS